MNLRGGGKKYTFLPPPWDRGAYSHRGTT